MLLRHDFTETIITILENHFEGHAENLFNASSLLQYLNIKTKAASRGAKSRAGFANHYALFVLIEDYCTNDFHKNSNYSKYDGAQFSKLFKRQRELPFGSKLQNHALNHRLNEEFHKYHPSSEALPIIRDVESNRYWINEKLLNIPINNEVFNIAPAVLEIIQSYVETRMSFFNSFMDECSQLLDIKDKDVSAAIDFIRGLLRPNVDARVFEIVSYAVLKQYYAGKVIYWGWSKENLNEESLVLYKTGRTNANDGGIDFVMKPLGVFFQVTETIDAGKYFLDIDKVQRYPIVFVVKSEEKCEKILDKIRHQAIEKYGIEKIVDRYMQCVEEIINVPILIERLEDVIQTGKIQQVIEEIILQSRVEFNVEEESDMLAFDPGAGKEQNIR